MPSSRSPEQHSVPDREAPVRLSLMLLAICCTVARAPSLFSRPRFWAEEGSEYFAFAWNHDWLIALLQPHLGYFSLIPNFSTTVSAKLVPLEWAPLVTTLIAMFVQLAPIVIILWGGDALWSDSGKKFLAVMAVLFTLASGETWLTTISSQFYLALATFLVLIGDHTVQTRVKTWVYRTLLCCAGLTGVISTLLAPLFLFKAITNRRREDTVRFTILAVCFAVQVTIATTALVNGTSVGERVGSLHFPLFASIVFVKSTALPILGIGAARIVSRILAGLLGGTNSEVVVVTLTVTVLFAALCWLLTASMNRRNRVLFVGSFVLLVVPSIILAVGPKEHLLRAMEGHRYFLVPNCILVLAGIASVDLRRSAYRFSRDLLASLVVASALFMGLLYFRPALSIAPGWPDWKTEVSRWRRDSSYQPEVWPPGWRVNLDLQDTSRPPHGAAPMNGFDLKSSAVPIINPDSNGTEALNRCRLSILESLRAFQPRIMNLGLESLDRSPHILPQCLRSRSARRRVRPLSYQAVGRGQDCRTRGQCDLTPTLRR